MSQRHNAARIATKLLICGKLEAAAYVHLKHLGELKRPYKDVVGRKAVDPFRTGV